MGSRANFHILLVDDEKASAVPLVEVLTSKENSVTLVENGEDALEALKGWTFDLVITDLVMPGMDGFALVKKIKKTYPNLLVFIFTGHDSFKLARRAQILGADDFLLKPVDPDQLTIALEQAAEKIALRNRLDNLALMVETRYSPANIVGNSPAMHEVFRLIDKARHSSANVLIHGESGTGKELAARAIYDTRHAVDKPFVSVNCCAIAEGLIESELFGHVRGAFSGAVSDRKGLFEVADGGIIFLDEVGDVSLNIQTKLLRVIQEGELRRVGENAVRHVDVRVVAATNSDLESAIRENRFREDLYYRLNVIPIRMPALRERPMDIPMLVEYFLEKFGKGESKKRFEPDAMELLEGYDFPGNVRELENIVQRAMSMVSSPHIRKSHIEPYLRASRRAGFQMSGSVLDAVSYDTFKQKINALEREFIRNHLRECGGNVAAAAHRAGTGRTAFHNRIRKLEIDPREFRDLGQKARHTQGRRLGAAAVEKT